MKLACFGTRVRFPQTNEAALSYGIYDQGIWNIFDLGGASLTKLIKIVDVYDIKSVFFSSSESYAWMDILALNELLNYIDFKSCINIYLPLANPNLENLISKKYFNIHYINHKQTIKIKDNIHICAYLKDNKAIYHYSSSKNLLYLPFDISCTQEYNALLISQSVLEKKIEDIKSFVCDSMEHMFICNLQSFIDSTDIYYAAHKQIRNCEIIQQSKVYDL